MISVIVPIYKIEKYIGECIESILNQSFKDFELILVDDGSPDKSGIICDDYQKKDSRITVIHKKNGGVTSARKAGFDVSKGDWICFVDGDDTLPNNALEIMYSYSEKVDIVSGNMKTSIFQSYRNIQYQEKLITSNQAIQDLLNRKMYSGLWSKLIRKKLFSAFVWDIPRKLTMGEDFIMCIRLFNNAYKIQSIKNVIYEYRIIDSSACATFKRSYRYDLMWTKYFLRSFRTHQLINLSFPIIKRLLKRFLSTTKKHVFN